MNFCINPHCPSPINDNDEHFCISCGSELLLKGRYRVLRLLGGGGFGNTYEVSDNHNNSTKVMKVLKLNQQKHIELFQQEARVLAYLNHPGIPKVEEDGYFIYLPRNSQDPIYCLVMEKIIGLDLEKWMSNRGMSPIDQKLAIKWLQELTEILHQVHQQNFFHRDIKPANIMLKADGNLALIDFGTVRQLTETYEVKIAAGQKVTGIISAGYTPNEQINGHAEPSSDFFALGRTFVYLLTGKHPLEPAIYDVQNQELNWNKYATHISPLLVDLVSAMMAHHPSQRPENTQKILEQLAEIEQILNSGGRYTPKLRRFRPGMQFPKTQRKFLLWWVLANIAGALITLYFAQALDVICPAIAPRLQIGKIIISPLLSMLFGTMQWLVLRKWFYRTNWWVLATALDTVISYYVIFFIYLKLISDSQACFPIISIPFMGIVQSLALRRFVRQAAWWIIAIPLCSIISGSTSGFFLKLLELTSYYNFVSINYHPVLVTFTEIIRFSIFGLLTGSLLIWLLRFNSTNS
ncbi:protein kinase [Nostoc sp. CHAB 5834]|nr:protein kinase [Nostoc sp. CHAB 5834]